jgi:Ca-activated chloride channel homolog
VSARSAWAVLLVVAAATAAHGQYQGEVQVDAVVVPVTVRNDKGRVVADVDPERFHLLVEGSEYAIPRVERENDLPLSLGFIVDTSGSMAGHKVEACKQMILAFLKERRPDDEVSLWTFGGERVLERFRFGTPLVLLPRLLDQIRPWSVTALYDMVQRVPEVMDRARHPRRAVVFLTDGVDNASKVDSAQANEIARGLNTPFYILGVEPPSEREDGLPGPSYEEVLRLIGDSSGGSYQRVPEAESMGAVVDGMLFELSSRFIISFSTSGAGAKKWRRLEVRVDGFKATTREGYVGTLP